METKPKQTIKFSTATWIVVLAVAVIFMLCGAVEFARSQTPAVWVKVGSPGFSFTASAPTAVRVGYPDSTGVDWKVFNVAAGEFPEDAGGNETPDISALANPSNLAAEVDVQTPATGTLTIVEGDVWIGCEGTITYTIPAAGAVTQVQSTCPPTPPVVTPPTPPPVVTPPAPPVTGPALVSTCTILVYADGTVSANCVAAVATTPPTAAETPPPLPGMVRICAQPCALLAISSPTAVLQYGINPPFSNPFLPLQVGAPMQGQTLQDPFAAGQAPANAFYALPGKTPYTVTYTTSTSVDRAGLPTGAATQVTVAAP